MDPGRGVGRRSFLIATGACTLPFAGRATGYSSKRDGRSKNGTVVFVYDDGPSEDYTKTFPVHRDEGVPACVAPVSGRIGSGRWIELENLRRIDRAGWEILSHTVDHRPMGALPLTVDAEEGDAKVYPQLNVYGENPGDDVRIFDDETHVVATVAGGGEDDTGEFVRLENPIGEEFDAWDGEIRYTDERLRHSLGNSKAQLETFGFEVSNLVLPYGVNGARAMELIPEYYDAVPNSTWDGNGRNDPETLDPHALHRAYFRDGEMTMGELDVWLDAVASEGSLGILGGHSQYESLTTDRIRSAIRMAKDRDIEIRTLRDALADRDSPETTTTGGVTAIDAPTAESATERHAPSTDGRTPRSTTESAAASTGQPGFGLSAAVTGLGFYAWHRTRE